MFHDLVKSVVSEIEPVLNRVKEEDVKAIVDGILNARRIIVHGAGRVGLACKGFAMRLGHLGREAYAVGDSTVPSIGIGDLLILASSSGETQTVYDVALLGKNNGAQVLILTAITDSRIAKVADFILELRAPTKFGPLEDCKSVQPMASLFEQCLQIFFDILVLLLMRETHQTHDDLWARHSNLD